MYMAVLPVYMYVSASLVPEEDTGSPGIAITAGCELPCGCRNSNSGLLEKEPLQALKLTFLIVGQAEYY